VTEPVASPDQASAASEPLADLPGRAEVLDSQQVFAGKIWDVRRDRLRFGDHEIVREYVDHPGAVAILAMDEADRVVLIRQYRHPIGERDWELPAGLLDVEGEERLAAAQRELAEEVDLAASEWGELLTVAPSPGGNSEFITIFEARGLSGVPTFLRSEEESELEVRWVALDEIVEAALAGRIRNGILITAALAAYARRR
jgi:8-oxo-dGTP pyrophosphatase MutT (NUDIX family)